MAQTVKPGLQKMGAAGAAGAVTIILTWIIQAIWGIDIPGEVQSSLTLLIGLAGLYYMPEKYHVSD
jgi:hypothetical protein